jgi:hypothetical protein
MVFPLTTNIPQGPPTNYALGKRTLVFVMLLLQTAGVFSRLKRDDFYHPDVFAAFTLSTSVGIGW